MQHVAAGTHRREPLASGGGRRGDVLELERDHAHAPGELGDGVEIVIGRANLQVGDLAGRRIVVGRQHVHAVAQPPGRDGEHPPELPAAENAERAAGRIAGITSASPRGPSRLVRHGYACSFCRSSGREVARIRTAKRPAFFAPASPIASVPTGMPPGICTIESSESSPERALLCTGTPSTGSTVCDATMPGKCGRAAGPGNDHLQAAAFGALRILAHPVGRAMGRDDLALVRHAELREHVGRMAHRLPVGLAPHDDANEGGRGEGMAQLRTITAIARQTVIDTAQADVWIGRYRDVEAAYR